MGLVDILNGEGTSLSDGVGVRQAHRGGKGGESQDFEQGQAGFHPLRITR